MSQFCTSGCYGYNLQLLANLFSANYSTAINPGSDANSITYVAAFFTLIKLLSLPTSGTISVAGGLTLSWSDPKLRWISSNYNNVTVIEIPTNSVWTPSLSLMNGVSQNLRIDLTSGSVGVASWNGQVTLATAREFDASCKLDLTYFPFDTQNCNFIFQSLDLRGYPYNSVRFVASGAANTEVYSPSGEFTLVNATMSSAVRELASFQLTLPTFSLSLTFARNPSYYIGTVAVPALLLLFTAGLVFLLPSDNSVKIAMACSLMVALYVLQQAVARMLPSSQSSSLLSVGIMIELGLGCYSLTCAILQVTLRAAQPPLSEGCVKFLLCCEPYLCSGSGRASRSANSVEPMKFDVKVSKTAEQTPSQSEKKDDLTEAIYALIKSNDLQVERAERAEANRLQKAEHARMWKVIDILLSIVFLSIYVTVSIITCVVFLFGVV